MSTMPRRVRKTIDRFLENHPQHKGEKLYYTIIEKGLHYIAVPRDEEHLYETGEKYDVVITPLPVIYGPALIICDSQEKPIGVFPW